MNNLSQVKKDITNFVAQKKMELVFEADQKIKKIQENALAKIKEAKEKSQKKDKK